jgi:hypothetical protein
MTSDASGNASWAAAPSGSTPSVAANDVDTTFTSASNPNQLGCNPTAFRNYKLGSSFVAGNVFTFYNRATSWNNYCLVQANDGSAIAILPPLGRVSVTCLSTTPTTNTAWSLQDRESQWVNYSPSWGNFGTSSSVNVSAMLDFKSLKIRGYFQTGTLIVGLAYFSMPSGVAMDGTSGVLLSNTTSSNGSPLGTYGNGTTYNNFGYLISATGTDTTNIYWSASFANAVGSQLLPSGVGNVAGQGNFVGFIADVPILY